MYTFGRRRFVKGALGTAAASWLGLHRLDLARAGLGAAAGARAVSDRVLLGKTGIKLSRMAMGGGTNGVKHTSVQGRLGVYGFADLLEYAYDHGVNFFDTADQYGTHEHVREGVRRVGRNNVVLMTKTRALTAADVRKDLDRFRRELGTDTLDIVLLHCMTSATWTKELEGPMEVLSRAKEQGIVRAHGCSCHSLAALELSARTPWVDVQLARINPIQSHMDADPATIVQLLRRMKQAGKGVLGMKIMGQGDLSNQVDRALAFAGKLDAIDAFTIGFAARAQFDEVARKLPGLSVA
jgi:aryl-alcohol dehydrogenase-like predicted oxidoreductase